LDPIPLIVPRAFRPFVAFAERIGRPVNLPPTRSLGSPLLPMAYAGRLLEEVATATGSENFGLAAGAASRFEDVPLAEDVRGALTVGSALEAAARASSRYCAGQHLWLTRRGEEVCVHRRFPDALRSGRRLANDFALQMLLDLIRRGAGPGWRPIAIHIEGPPPGHAEELAALSTGSASFGAAADCVVLPRSILALPLRAAPSPCTPPSPPLLDMGWADSVRQTIRYLLATGELTLPNLAETAGTSPRSIQRRLAATRLTFGQLVDEARFQTACRLLREPGIRIIDVCVELGYSDAANFTRAFRRWAGVSPLEFRRALRPGAGPGSRPART